jgi:hypothetical protein
MHCINSLEYKPFETIILVCHGHEHKNSEMLLHVIEILKEKITVRSMV